MHSSRMRTTRFNCHLRSGWACPGVCVGGERVSAQGCVCDRRGEGCLPRGCGPRGRSPRPRGRHPPAHCMLGYTPPQWTEFLTHARENMNPPPPPATAIAGGNYQFSGIAECLIWSKVHYVIYRRLRY